MALQAIAFYLMAAVTVAAGFCVVSARNPVHAVLWLILAFFSAAGLFVLMGAEFLAMLLVVVYVGAVAVLFLFVVMMLDVDFASLRQGFARYMPLGLLIGRVPLVRKLLDPVLQILRPVPVTASLPLAMILFGLGPRSAFFLVFLGAFYPILVNTVFGVRSVEPRLFEAAAMLGCTGPAQFVRVVLPAALPSIFTGLRLGLGFAWVVIVVGEMTGVQTGLGAIIMEARQLSRTEIVICGMAVIGVAGFVSDWLVMQLSRRLLAWSPNHG